MYNTVFIRSYRLAAYRQFTNWTYNFLGKANRIVVLACVMTAMRYLRIERTHMKVLGYPG